MFHKKRVPTDAVRVAMDEAADGRLSSPVIVDASSEIAGCLSHYLPQTRGDRVFVAVGPAVDCNSDEQATTLALSVRSQLEDMSASGSPQEAGALVWDTQLPTIVAIVRYVLSRFDSALT